MDIDRLYDEEFAEHAAVTQASLTALRAPLRELVAASLATLRGGGKIALFGNGGSAADAQHLATELTVRYRRDRAPIAALALTTDTSALTAIGNDFGFERVFARQIEALCRPGDLCLGLSTSGRSANVVNGLRTARALGCVAAALGGGDGGEMVGLAEPLLLVPSTTTARIQEMHHFIGHLWCAALERALGLA